MKRLSKFLVLLAATALVTAAAADALYAAQHKKSGSGGSTSTYPVRLGRLDQEKAADLGVQPEQEAPDGEQGGQDEHGVQPERHPSVRRFHGPPFHPVSLHQ